MPSEQTHSDENISALVDASFERKLVGVTTILQQQVDNRIRDQIKAERDFVKETIGVAFKIAGAAVALVALVLGAFSLKTFGDVKREILATAKTATEKQLEQPASKRTIDGILDRAILDSYLIRLASLEADKTTETVFAVEDLDATRLFRIIRNADTDEDTFGSAVRVLSSVIPEDDSDNVHKALISQIGRQFAAIIAAKDPELEWLNKAPARRRLIISKVKEKAFGDDDIKTTCCALAAARTSPVQVRREAIDYLASVHATEAVEPLSALVNSSDQELALPALVALSKIKPDREMISRWIKQVNKTNSPSPEQVLTALQLCDILRESAVSEDALKLLDFASRNSRLNGYAEDPMLRIYVGDEPRAAGLIPKSVIWGDEDEINGGSSLVLAILKKYAAENDLANFRRFLAWTSINSGVGPRRRIRRYLLQYRVKIDFADKGTIKLIDKMILNKANAPDGVTLLHVPRSALRASDELFVVWTDSKDQLSKREKLDKFDKPESFSFSLVDASKPQAAPSIADRRAE